MGFWQTGYFEFHEPWGLDESCNPTPLIFHCQHCNAEFDTTEELRTHRFEKHKYNNPALYISGEAVGDVRFRVVSPLSQDDIKAINYDIIRVNDKSVTFDQLKCLLADYRNDTVFIELENKGALTKVSLEFEIPNHGDLNGIDQCFIEFVRKKRLDRRAVEDFIDSTVRYRTARRYSSGICEYFYGVMAKERTETSSIPYESYIDKYNRSVSDLKYYPRNLAKVICALIEFHFNHFLATSRLSPGSRVGNVANRFVGWLSGNNQVSGKISTGKEIPEKLITDLQTEKILQWCATDSSTLLSMEEEIKSFVETDIPEFDKVKLRVLLAETYAATGLINIAKIHAHGLINKPGLDIWAARIINL
jgi:hypothetical protein